MGGGLLLLVTVQSERLILGKGNKLCLYMKLLLFIHRCKQSVVSAHFVSVSVLVVFNKKTDFIVTIFAELFKFEQ